MLTGVDIGGTNTDFATVGDEITAYKVPNAEGFAGAFSRGKLEGRLAVSTSQPLNRILTGDPISVHILTVPGPGLCCHDGMNGAVSHRGDIVEQIDPEEIADCISRNRQDALAIICKFSIRNSSIEEEIAKIAGPWYPEERIALSHFLGRMNFPARIITTELNARLKNTVSTQAEIIRRTQGDFLFFKGDGGLASPKETIQCPSLLYNSSAAAVALGAHYLTGENDCLIVDIGGTTTDLVPIKEGNPVMEIIFIDKKRTMIESVRTHSLPYGGDSVIRETLKPGRIGNALAFGGPAPTLTDALNCTGEEIGTHGLSKLPSRAMAETIVDKYVAIVVEAVKVKNPPKLIGAGFLSPYLIPRIGKEAGVPYTVPYHAECANAIGVAVSRVSLTLYARFDTGRNMVAYNGQREFFEHTDDDEELIKICIDEVRRRALESGAYADDVRDIRLQYFNAYDVIRGGYRAERITDIIVQIPPGITAETR